MTEHFLSNHKWQVNSDLVCNQEKTHITEDVLTQNDVSHVMWFLQLLSYCIGFLCMMYHFIKSEVRSLLQLFFLSHHFLY